MNGQDKAAVDQNRIKRWALVMVLFAFEKGKFLLLFLLDDRLT